MRITITLALVFIGLALLAKLWLSGGLLDSAPSVSTALDSPQGGQVAQVIQHVVKGPHAPEISSAVWLNSPALMTQDLRSKVVVVEFWTHG